jgi:hypothetical protein
MAYGQNNTKWNLGSKMQQERVRSPNDIVGLNIKLRERERAALEQAARVQGRSLTAEVALRLQESVLKEVYEPFHAQVGELLAQAWRTSGRMAMDATGGDANDWINNPAAYREAIRAVVTILETFAPEGTDLSSPSSDPGLGTAVARMLLEHFPSRIRMPAAGEEFIAGPILRRLHRKDDQA